jgi:hypothetical protein
VVALRAADKKLATPTSNSLCLSLLPGKPISYPPRKGMLRVMKSDQDLYKRLRDLPKEQLWNLEVPRFDAAIVASQGPRRVVCAHHKHGL